MDFAQRARAYLAGLEQGRSFDELAPFLHPDVVLFEHPNLLVAQGKTRRLTDARVAFEAGRKAVSAQRYGVRTVVTEGTTVALEVEWEGTLSVPLGELKAGGVMRCASAMFLRFDTEGRIIRQDNYDCFSPF
jgi:ketosteroid isomerase-like protein